MLKWVVVKKSRLEMDQVDRAVNHVESNEATDVKKMLEEAELEVPGDLEDLQKDKAGDNNNQGEGRDDESLNEFEKMEKEAEAEAAAEADEDGGIYPEVPVDNLEYEHENLALEVEKKKYGTGKGGDFDSSLVRKNGLEEKKRLDTVFEEDSSDERPKESGSENKYRKQGKSPSSNVSQYEEDFNRKLCDFEAMGWKGLVKMSPLAGYYDEIVQKKSKSRRKVTESLIVETGNTYGSSEEDDDERQHQQQQENQEDDDEFEAVSDEDEMPPPNSHAQTQTRSCCSNSKEGHVCFDCFPIPDELLKQLHLQTGMSNLECFQAVQTVLKFYKHDLVCSKYYAYEEAADENPSNFSLSPSQSEAELDELPPRFTPVSVSLRSKPTVKVKVKVLRY